MAIHFRNATCGGVSKELTHPFAVSKNIDEAICMDSTKAYSSVLMHNGVISNFGDKEISDTLDFNCNILASVEETTRPRLLDMFSSKFLLMQNETYYFLGSGWENHKGLRVSNSYWNYRPVTYAYSNGAIVPHKKGARHAAYVYGYDDDYCEYYARQLKKEESKIITLENSQIIESSEVIQSPIEISEANTQVIKDLTTTN